MRNFVFRTVKNGRVKIFGRYYYPSKQYADAKDRFDGKRYAFGLYRDYSNNGYERYINFYSSEHYFKTREQTEADKIMSVDDVFLWMFWYIK